MSVEETSIVVKNTKPCKLSHFVDNAIHDALALESKLPNWLLQMQGMSGRLYRRFINNLVGQIDACRYLEVGSWAGSTACSAMYANKCSVICIDNWSQFGGPKETFLKMTSAARSDDVDFTFLEQDFRSVNFAALNPADIFLFDGPHSYQDQSDGIKAGQPAVKSTYIQVVDDWNWRQVREGTQDAISKLALNELHRVEIKTTQNDSKPEAATNQNSAWHNGYFIAVLEKRV